MYIDIETIILILLIAFIIGFVSAVVLTRPRHFT